MPYGKDNWGIIYANGTSSGMIGSVYRKEAELGIGCYYNWYNDIFETSVTIAKSAVTIIGPAPSRYPAYMTNILPFSKVIWTMIFLTIIVGSVVMHGIRFVSFRMNHSQKDKIPKLRQWSLYQLTLLEIVAIFFQQSFSQNSLDHCASRLFMSCLLLAGVTLEYTYSGQLKSLLTIPLFTDPVDTINKFALTNWKWGAPAQAWVLTIAKSDIPYEQIMTKKFEIRSYGELKNATYSGTYGLAVERLHGGSYAFGDYIRDGGFSQMILSKDDIFFDWTRAFSIRGWPLMDYLNTHILWCLEHGLYKYWEFKHASNYLDKQVQETFQSQVLGQSCPKTTVPISDISGPLLALAFGYLFASLALLMEISVSFMEKLLNQIW